MRVALLILAAVAFAALACRAATPADTPPAGGNTGAVRRVVDGDTFDIVLPGGATDRVRVLGVDTPERSGNRPTEYTGVTDVACLDRWGQKASEFARGTLEGERVTLETDPAEGPRDRFGRLLAYVRTDGGDFGARLLEGGYARVYTEGSAGREETYLASERTARQAGVGLWSCGPGTTPGAGSGVVIESVDRVAEVAVILNRGDAPVDLRGWVLVSRTGDQRFTFPVLVLDPGACVRVTSGRDAVHDPPSSLRWTASAVWNDAGDAAALLDASGREVSQIP